MAFLARPGKFGGWEVFRETPRGHERRYRVLQKDGNFLFHTKTL